VDVAMRVQKAAFSKDANHIVRAKGSASWESVNDALSINRWKPELLARLADGVGYVNALGMLDQHAAGAAFTFTFAEAVPGGMRWLNVPNYAHGMGAIDYAVTFRNMLQQAAGIGKKLLSVDARWDWDTNVVTASASHGSDDDYVDLWCTTGIKKNKAVRDYTPDCSSKVNVPAEDDADLRQREWSATSMTRSEGGTVGTYSAKVPVKALALNMPTCLVRVQDSYNARVATSAPLYNRAFCETAGFMVTGAQQALVA